MSANFSRKGFEPLGKPLPARKYVAGGTVYPGDAVVLNSSGLVVRAAASQALLGVAASYATSGQNISVWDNPSQIYSVQASGSAITAQTSVGNNANIVVPTTSPSYKNSDMELDSSSLATGSASTTLPLRILGVLDEVDNSLAAGAHSKIIVDINNHMRKGSTGRDGV